MKLTKHINKQHADIQNIFSCPYCTMPFNQYTWYISHLKEHKDKEIKCRICGEVCTTISKLRAHTKLHVNQCPFCSLNFPCRDKLFKHINVAHGERAPVEEKQGACTVMLHSTPWTSSVPTTTRCTDHTVVTFALCIFQLSTSCWSTERKTMVSHPSAPRPRPATRVTSRQNWEKHPV